MKVIAVIPARYASTRFPAKMLKDLAGKPVIVRTYEAVKATGLFDSILVATDSEEIKKVLALEGVDVFMSKQLHESGSDRIAEAVKNISVDIVVNIQGDEPFVSKDNLKALLDIFRADDINQVDVASVMTPINNTSDCTNPNNVKVVTDVNGFALYFSRAVIPYSRDNNQDVEYYKHLGIYAFRKQALLDFTKMPSSTLESIEKLEQLRYLENGKKIKMVKTNHMGIGIDTPDDLLKAIDFFKSK